MVEATRTVAAASGRRRVRAMEGRRWSMVEYLEGGAWRIDLIQEEERSRCNMWSDKGEGKWKVGENWRRKRLCFQNTFFLGESRTLVFFNKTGIIFHT